MPVFGANPLTIQDLALEKTSVIVPIRIKGFDHFVVVKGVQLGRVMIGDPDEGEAPEVFRHSGARYMPLSLKKMTKAIPGSWPNMVALGLATPVA